MLAMLPSLPIRLQFERGTLTIDEDQWSQQADELLAPFFCYDQRSRQYRAQAASYGPVALTLHRAELAWQDETLGFGRHTFKSQLSISPRDYQLQALQAWEKHQRRGCVILPTGTGKTHLAILAIESAGRDTLVLVPTIDLMLQWQKTLKKAFATEIGAYGGGCKEIKPITVITYDSALLMMEHFGQRWGLLIADEAHHLPGPTYQWIARSCIAPFRLGLTATPERSDSGETLLWELMGPCIYRKEIQELRGAYLAPYETEVVEVPLSEAEAAEYTAERQLYREFLVEQNIDMSSVTGWQDFLASCFRSLQGKRAWQAWRRQKTISREAKAKLEFLWELILDHRQDRILIFTEDNATAYLLGQRFSLPVLTHQTSAVERKIFLEAFSTGALPILVTSKVLNEGVDVPEANIGVILSGSGSSREHVQRLGRILRPGKNKVARLYELITEGTGEVYQSRRRRDHHAYR